MAPSLVELLLVCFVLALPFVYETSKAFRFFFKFFVYYGLVMTIALFMIPIMAFRAWDVRNLVFSSSFTKHITKLIGVQWTLKGSHHLAKQESCVIVANHQSSLDILGMFQIWHVMQRCTVVAKKELFYAWPFGLSAWLCGLIFIDRFNSEKARDAVNKAAMKIKAEKTKLWIFPEGTRRNTGEIHPFKKGAFYVALAAQLPIQPVVLSRYYFLDDKRRTFDSGKIIISALPPISTEGLTVDDMDDIMSRVRQQMIDEYARISEEVKTLGLCSEKEC